MRWDCEFKIRLLCAVGCWVIVAKVEVARRSGVQLSSGMGGGLGVTAMRRSNRRERSVTKFARRSFCLC